MLDVTQRGKMENGRQGLRTHNNENKRKQSIQLEPKQTIDRNNKIDFSTSALGRPKITTRQAYRWTVVGKTDDDEATGHCPLQETIRRQRTLEIPYPGHLPNSGGNIHYHPWRGDNLIRTSGNRLAHRDGRARAPNNLKRGFHCWAQYNPFIFLQNCIRIL